MKTLLLANKDVKRLLSMKEVMNHVELSFREKGLNRVQMPAKQYLFYRKHKGDLRIMPSYLEKLDISAVKIVNVHPENRKRHGLPTVMATIILVDPRTGAPEAIMGGTWITALRTGAAGAIAAKYLANPNPKTVGMVGAGTQARTQLMGLQLVFKTIEEVKVWDLNEKASLKYTEEMKNSQISIFSVKNIMKAVQDSDIIVTATPSRKPLVSAEWVDDGTHINCIGADAPGKQELDPAILVKSKIVVDNWDQASHSGEINVPLKEGILTRANIWGEIGEIITGLKPGRSFSHEITVFTSTGLAVQDAVTAQLAYKKASEKKIGHLVELV